MEPSADLEKLEKEVIACRRCPLYKSRNTPVFGEGNPNAEIFIIGEAPGRDEDMVGRPFVGRSGELLDKIFSACGFNRAEHLYIGNIIKCRPPGNRTPLPVEVSQCLPFLRKQIEWINPAIIVLLGASALASMVDVNLKITRERGKWIRQGGRWIMPVYHPSALLRNPSLKRETWEDFKKIISKYRELINPKHHSNYF